MSGGSKSKSPFKSNENLNNGANQNSGKFDSMRSQENNQYASAGNGSRVNKAGLQQQRNQNSQSAHAARNQGSQFMTNPPASSGNHNQSVS